MKISNRTALVTGGASGLGAACVRRFAAAGYNIVVADVAVERGEALANELGESVRFIRADVCSETEGAEAVDLACSHFGGLHVLIHCAGILGGARTLGRAGPHSLSEFRRVVEVNLVGTFNMSRLAALAMAKNTPNAEGERGVIVNTSSVAAFEGQIGQTAYAAAKGGVASLTLPLARDLARYGIRVAAIAPGVFDTQMMAGISPERQQSLAQQAPFPSRLGKPDEFARLAAQVVENTMLNGCVLRLDGALRMGPT